MKKLGDKKNFIQNTHQARRKNYQSSRRKLRRGLCKPHQLNLVTFFAKSYLASPLLTEIGQPTIEWHGICCCLAVMGNSILSYLDDINV